VTIREALPDEWDLVRLLFREYQHHIGADLCFQDFEAELAALPGAYAPPQGGIFLCWIGDDCAGVAAFRPLGAATAEMKRLFVRPEHHGRGAGRQLALAVAEAARAAGYRHLRLDTLPTMNAAIALYRQLGFREIPPYTSNPVEGALFFELDL
jgi:ribosomal protein S18 acetylase RimI-like enzyme